ncbi:hypothetical protein [Photobacterium damselae]|uniref:hypothetical protein n=1 Tax=Photobacterium damselae TaxID=38293 RepID=UPI0040688B00
MKVRPIIFNTKMVQALLSGQKVVTRRPVPNWQLPKLTYDGTNYMTIAQRHPRWGFGLFGDTPDDAMQEYNKGYSSLCPFGGKGDCLYVRESMTVNDHQDICYVADDKQIECVPDDWYYRDQNFTGRVPSVHMPRWASRLTLKILNTRVEKVQDITVEQALAEGFSMRMEFVKAWNTTYKNWKSNPYVWVIEFEIIASNVDTLISDDSPLLRKNSFPWNA